MNCFLRDQNMKASTKISISVEDICKEIQRLFQPRKIVMFGSRAQGNFHRDSDIDLLVILNDFSPFAKLKRYERFEYLLKNLHGFDHGIDALILTQSELDKNLSENEGEWNLILEILESGILIYDQNEEKEN
ncbi:MAG: nucleotidyltransferase domain-containing protein [Calditrichaeota bacterium]|nr:MAG: nucleotidyltransferase domain-containing protein [Calditrichota bacterium]